MEQQIISECMAQGWPLPDKIKNAPDLPFGTEFYLLAFYDLNSSRPVGWGLSPIPWIAIHQYAEALSLGEEEADDLFFFVRHLDQAFLAYHEGKSKRTKT